MNHLKVADLLDIGIGTEAEYNDENFFDVTIISEVFGIECRLYSYHMSLIPKLLNELKVSNSTEFITGKSIKLASDIPNGEEKYGDLIKIFDKIIQNKIPLEIAADLLVGRL